MQQQLEQSPKNLMEALLRCNFPKIEKTGSVKHNDKEKYKHIEYGHLLSQVGPILRQNGIVYSAHPITFENPFYVDNVLVIGKVITRLTHAASGTSTENEEPLLLRLTTYNGQYKTTVENNLMQKLGEANTYAKRYGLIGILGLDADIDNDNHEEHGEKKEDKKEKPKGNEAEAIQTRMDMIAEIKNKWPAVRDKAIANNKSNADKVDDFIANDGFEKIKFIKPWLNWIESLK